MLVMLDFVTIFLCLFFSLKIVERTIETLSSKQAANANVICSGYEKVLLSFHHIKLFSLR